MQLSYNKLKAFSDCALKYRYAYVERQPRSPIASLTSQRRLHAALAKYHFYAKRDGVVRPADLLEAYAEISGANADASVRDSRSYRDGEEVLRKYCERENAAERTPAYLEHKLRVEFGPYILTGTVDRLDFSESGGYSLIDYKLDRKLPEANSAEDSQQLSFYDLLVFEGMGVAPDDVRLYYLRHGVEHVSSRSRAQRRDTVAWVEETAASIREERKWEPREGESCRTCPFAQLCPAKTGVARAQKPVWQQTSLLELAAS
jgi:RecB family exonuclease